MAVVVGVSVVFAILALLDAANVEHVVAPSRIKENEPFPL